MAGRCAYALLALDLDGTLLDSQQRLPPPNRRALHRARRAGLRIVLCTGRSFTETRPVLAQIGLELDAGVTASGAILNELPGGRSVERMPIPRAEALAATRWFQRRGYPVLWLYDRSQAGFDGYDIAGPRRHANYDRWLARTPCRVRRSARIPDDGFDPVRITIVDDAAALRRLAADFGPEFHGRLTHNCLRIPGQQAVIIEALAWPVNKWRGIARLCQRWGVDPAGTVAIGDEVNDVEMVRRAGLGVAVANACPAVKRVARRVVGSNDDCAVAELVAALLGGGV